MAGAVSLGPSSELRRDNPIYVLVFAYACIFVHICTHVCACAGVHVYVHVYVHTCGGQMTTLSVVPHTLSILRIFETGLT